jgi:hypothetical protein
VLDVILCSTHFGKKKNYNLHAVGDYPAFDNSGLITIVVNP